MTLKWKRLKFTEQILHINSPKMMIVAVGQSIGPGFKVNEEGNLCGMQNYAWSCSCALSTCERWGVPPPGLTTLPPVPVSPGGSSGRTQEACRHI